MSSMSVDDALDDDVRVRVLRFVEQFRQRFLGRSRSSPGRRSLLGLDDFLGQFEQLLQELQAGEEALLVALLDLFQPLAKRR